MIIKRERIWYKAGQGRGRGIEEITPIGCLWRFRTKRSMAKEEDLVGAGVRPDR